MGRPMDMTPSDEHGATFIMKNYKAGDQIKYGVVIDGLDSYVQCRDIINMIKDKLGIDSAPFANEEHHG